MSINLILNTYRTNSNFTKDLTFNLLISYYNNNSNHRENSKLVVCNQNY